MNEWNIVKKHIIAKNMNYNDRSLQELLAGGNNWRNIKSVFGTTKFLITWHSGIYHTQNIILVTICVNITQLIFVIKKWLLWSSQQHRLLTADMTSSLLLDIAPTLLDFSSVNWMTSLAELFPVEESVALFAMTSPSSVNWVESLSVTMTSSSIHRVTMTSFSSPPSTLVLLLFEMVLLLL